MGALQTLADTASRVIINPLLALFFALGLLTFIYGLLEFLWDINVRGGHDKEKGKRHMLWGIIGMFVMISAYTILKLISDTVCTGGFTGCRVF